MWSKGSLRNLNKSSCFSFSFAYSTVISSHGPAPKYIPHILQYESTKNTKTSEFHSAKSLILLLKCKNPPIYSSRSRHSFPFRASFLFFCFGLQNIIYNAAVQTNYSKTLTEKQMIAFLMSTVRHTFSTNYREEDQEVKVTYYTANFLPLELYYF